MRVLVTGATGFVGSHVTRALALRGHEVHALVQPADREEELAKERFGDVESAVRRVRADLLDKPSWESVLEKERFEACVHLGWYAHPKDYLSSQKNLDLLAASMAFGAKLVETGTKRVVMAGTCFEYDVSLGYLSESSALGPQHLYSACKKALFDVMTRLTSGTQTTFAWARLFFLYGPYEQQGRLVPAVIDALLAGERARVTTGEQFRDFLHVADAAAAIVHVLEHEALTGPVNIGSGEPVRVREVVETIARVLGKAGDVAWGAVEARPNDPPFVCANVTKLAASGFRHEQTLESGIQDTVAWSRSARAKAPSDAQE